MKKQTFITVSSVLIISLSMLLGQPLLGSAKLSSISGAIFTTDETGLLVDGNIYENALDVYLSGGPGPNAPPDAAGLPDDDYYFQVTDPAGKRLLSTDNIENRSFRVLNGIITEYLGTTHNWNSIGSEIPNAIVIQLWPFGKTPNKGGVYKAWATPIDKYDPTDPHSFFGFIPRYSKTDNYKVRKEKPITRLILDKFYDVDNSGIYDNDDYLITSWTIQVTDTLGVTNTYHTPRVVDVTGNPPGTYTITEDLPAGWQQTAVAVDGTYMPVDPTVTVEIENGETHDVLYGNRKKPVRPTTIRLFVSPALPDYVSPGGTESFLWTIEFLTTPVLVTLEVMDPTAASVYTSSWDVSGASSPISGSDSWTAPLDAMLGYYTVTVKYYSEEIGPVIPEATASRVFSVA